MKKSISDMNLVATMLSLEVSYTDVRRGESERRRLEFLFEEDSVAKNAVILENGVPVVKEELSLDEIESYHVSGSLLVSTDRLCSALKNVKSVIHGKR